MTVTHPQLLVMPQAEGFQLENPSLEEGKSSYGLILEGLPEDAEVSIGQDSQNASFALEGDRIAIAANATGPVKLTISIACDSFEPLKLIYRL